MKLCKENIKNNEKEQQPTTTPRRSPACPSARARRACVSPSNDNYTTKAK
jgi:hypothetical protein